MVNYEAFGETMMGMIYQEYAECLMKRFEA